MTLPATGYTTANWTNPASALSDFTGLLNLANLPSEWWAACTSSDGTKVRVAKDDGTEIPVDPIDFNLGAETGWLRFKWASTLASSGTQAVRIYPADTGNDSYAAGDAYGQYNAYDSSWKAYWPLTNLSDRTVNGHTLTAFNTPTSGQSGQVGSAYLFDDASSEYLGINTAVVTAVPCTLMFWGRSDNATADQLGISICNSAAADQYFSLGMTGNLSGDPVSAVARAGAGYTPANTSSGYSTNTWHHCAGVFASSTSRSAYIDGGSKVTETTSITPSSLNRTAIGVLYRSSLAGYFSGHLDDVQIHSAARADAWIAHERLQSANNATFWGTWTWVPPAGGGTILPFVTNKHANRMALIGGRSL